MKHTKKKKNPERVSLITMAGFPMDTPRADILIPQQMWIDEQLHPRMLNINFGEFKKEKVEKDLLKLTKKEHNNAMRAAGKNPNKQLNTSAPIQILWKAY